MRQRPLLPAIPRRRSANHENSVAAFKAPNGTRRRDTTPPRPSVATPPKDSAAMVELPSPTDRVGNQSKLAESLYELSISARSLADVVKQLHNFRRWAPLRHYSYAELIDLIHAAGNCPTDVLFGLVKIGGSMVDSGNFPDAKSCEIVDNVIIRLHNDNAEFPSFGVDQQTARSELKQLHDIFNRRIARPPPSPSPSANWTTRDMEAVIRRQEKRAATPMNDAEVQEYLIQRAAMKAARGDGSSESSGSSIMQFDSDSPPHEHPDPDVTPPQKRPPASPTIASGDDLPTGSPRRQKRRPPASPTRLLQEPAERSVPALVLDAHSDSDSPRRRPGLDVTPAIAVFDHESPSKRRARSPNRLEVEVSGLREWMDPRTGLPERVDRGLAKYHRMDERQRGDVQLLADLFTGWDDAYASSKAVWQRMKADPNFDVDVLISQIRLSFADFLVSAIRQFMQEEGFG